MTVGLRLTYTLGLASSVLLSCGQDGTAPPGKVSGRQFLSIGTAPPGGAFFVVGGALSEVLNQHRGESHWESTAEATKGSQENIRRLETGELELALANSAITYFAVRGQEGWDRTYDVRTMMTLAPNIALFLTPADSGIKQIRDLKGHRGGVGVAGAGFEYFVKPLLAAHGVTYEDFTPLHNTQIGSVDMLADGSVSAAFLGGAVPTASITQATSSREMHFIPYTEEAKEELIREYPFFQPATIPAGTYTGQDKEYRGLDVGSMHLIVNADMDEELVYQVTRTIYENRDRVTEKHAAGRAINPKNVVRDTGTPFHPGSIRYYREIGIWPTEGDVTTQPEQPLPGEGRGSGTPQSP